MEENKSQATTTQTQTASTAPDEETKSFLEKIFGWARNGEVPGSTDTAGTTQEPEGNQTTATSNADEGKKTYTAEEVQQMIADEQKKWQQSQKPATKATETKAEAKVTEAERIAKLEADLRKRDASKMLSEAGYPEELVDLLTFSDEDSMKASFDKVTSVFQKSLENGIKTHLKGRTPQSANDTKAGSVESQKENARKLLGIKKK